MQPKKIQILWARTSILPLYWYIKAHTHNYYHLFYAVDGPVEFVINNKKTLIEADTCILVPPGMIHELTENHPEDAKVHEVKFHILDSYLADNLRITDPVLQGTNFAQTVIPYISERWIDRDAQTLENIDILMSAFLIDIIRKNSSKENPRRSRFIRTDSFNDVTKDIIDYIEKNYVLPLSLNVLAKKTGYSKTHLCNIFVKNTGYTIIEYLNYIRIRMAAECLSYTGMDIFTTSRYMGFENVSYFSRKFKMLVGISPSQYRKMMPICENGSIGNVLPSDNIFTERAESIEEAHRLLKELGKLAKRAQIPADERIARTQIPTQQKILPPEEK